nr:T9SS type A sorting domain-containing protein [uncultured Chryseobacterium sp.]
MKKIFTSLVVILSASLATAQVITQNSTPNTVDATGSVACGSQTAGYTADNYYTRVFNLADYGITYNYNVTNVAFGVQTANLSFPVALSLSTFVGNYPTGVETPLGASVNVNVATANQGAMVSTGTTLTRLVPAGSKLVVKVFHDGSAAIPPQVFYMGINSGAQTGPSYLESATCGITTPLATGTGGLASFASARWVMTITGQNATLGTTEVINSRDLKIYPNPVKDILRFSFSNNLKSESIEINDMNGRTITSVSNTKNVNEINMSSYATGNYIVRVKANDGKIYIQKIIKE